MNFMGEVADQIVNLNQNIAEHENRRAKVHPESETYRILGQRIKYLQKARDGLRSYVDSIDIFWELDIKAPPPANDPDPRG